VSPRPRAAYLVVAVAAAALVIPVPLAAVALLGLVTVAVVDALAARRPPRVERTVPRILSRGVPAPLRLDVRSPAPGRVRLRQPLPPDLRATPSEADDGLEATVVARRRGRHTLAAPAARVDGPLGLGCWYHRPGDDEEVLVYPDLVAAFRLALAVRQGLFRETGQRARGPLGLGTDFESIREYLPDDDVRQVNWPATARMGRPMSNQYRVEQDRDVVLVVDCGRLMGAPLGDRTRLDAAVDAVAAVASVADVVGDRCGVVAFDTEVRRSVSPRRKGARAVIRGVFDLEPTSSDSDYELAFRTVRGLKRAFVLVLTDLLDEAAARTLVEAVPLLARRHAVAVASAADTDLEAILRREPRAPVDVYAAAVALDVLGARARVTAQLRRAGADVLEAPPDRLGAACVATYLRAKARARL
jgi:uncharacterized protein (DUF58 family)